MSWDAVIAFLDMDGHALYVWAAYALGLALLVADIMLIALRKRAIRVHLGIVPAHKTNPVGPLADAPARRSVSQAREKVA